MTPAETGGAGAPGSLDVGGVRLSWDEDWADTPSPEQARVGWAHHGLALLRSGRLVGFHPERPDVVVYDPSGRCVGTWATGLSEGHGITVVEDDGEERIWIADPGSKMRRSADGEYRRESANESGQAVQFDLDGSVTMRLARPDHRAYETGWYAPTSIAVDEQRHGGNGEIFVADGYGQSLVHRFAPDGSYLTTLDGEEGPGGRFNCPHGIMIDRRRDEPELLVADRAKAAGELRQRLGSSAGGNVVAGTFHSVGYRIWEQYREHRQLPRLAVTSNPKRLMTAVCEELRGHLDPRAVLRAYQSGTARGLTWRDAAAVFPSQAAREVLVEALERYERLKQKRGVMDLSDLLRLPAAAIEKDGDFAESIRWRYRHLLVDEAQDMNQAQWRLLRQILGGGDDVWLVGDANQAIYGWNGADRSIVETQFLEAYPAARRFELRTNYRSGSHLVALADRVIGVMRPTIAAPHREPGTVRVRSFGSAADEAQFVAWEIHRLRASGVGLSQIAVLARTKERLAPIERELRNQDLPLRTGRHVLDEPIVVKALRLLEQSKIDFPASSCLAELREIVDELVSEMLAPVVDDEDRFGERPSVDRATKRSIERLDQLIELVDEWRLQFPSSRLSLLRDWLASSLRSRGGDPGEPHHGVELMTIHRSKGLEFGYVFIVGLEDDVLPLPHAEDSGEERRVFYVALTRAEDGITLSWSRSRSGTETGPSPYLADVEAAFAASDDGVADRAAVVSRIREIRVRLREPSATGS